MFKNYIRYSLNFILLSVILYLPFCSSAQTLPIGTPVLEDALRRAQLLGQIDSTLSFTSGPLFQNAFPVKDIFNPDAPSNKIPVKNVVFKLLPVIWQQQYNSHHPEGWNDGSMVPARGYQTLFSAGIYAKYGPLSIQLRPEVVYAENKDFQGFYKEQPDQVWAEYYTLHNAIDMPERFGKDAYKKLFPGQSSVRLTLGSVSLGISSENLWWGPGARNALIMSNSAPSFNHITLNTVKPLRTKIGSFEGQIICGRLENSGFAPSDTNRTYNGYKLYVRKRTDWRYLNGTVLTYQPKWVPGLFLGATRTFIMYYKDMGRGINDYLPVITPLSKKANFGESEGNGRGDQRASFFIRWLWQKAHAELYTEYLREDHAFDLRDFIVQPEYTHAYLFGIRKVVPLKNLKNQFLQINLEITQIEQTTTDQGRSSKNIYSHCAGVPQGHTHQGQLLGAGIGPGSNLQSLSLSWVKGLKTVGIELERFVHNNDLHNAAIKDPRANWVDMDLSVFGDWNYRNFIFSAKAKWVKSYNYQHFYQPVSGSEADYWDPGRNTYNFRGQLAVMYRF